MSYQLQDQAEAAFVILLTPIVKAALGIPSNTSAIPVPCYAGRYQLSRSIPNVTCACMEVGPEEPKDSGNFWVSMEISVKTHAPQEPGANVSTTTQAKALLSAVNTEIYDGGLEDELNAAVTDFNCFVGSVIRPGWSPREYDSESNCWVDKLNVRFYGCACNLDPIPFVSVNGQLYPTVTDSGEHIWSGSDISTGQTIFVYVKDGQGMISTQPPP